MRIYSRKQEISQQIDDEKITGIDHWIRFMIDVKQWQSRLIKESYNGNGIAFWKGIIFYSSAYCVIVPQYIPPRI
jgi:hypothetical protein